MLEVEVARSIRRWAPAAIDRVGPVLIGIVRFAVSPAVRRTAAWFPEPFLRSIDAVHLATALPMKNDLEAFVSYDRRLLAAAAAAGLPAVSPGDEV
jgi:hypothetical protein